MAEVYKMWVLYVTVVPNTYLYIFKLNRYSFLTSEFHIFLLNFHTHQNPHTTNHCTYSWSKWDQYFFNSTPSSSLVSILQFTILFRKCVAFYCLEKKAIFCFRNFPLSRKNLAKASHTIFQRKAHTGQL